MLRGLRGAGASTRLNTSHSLSSATSTASVAHREYHGDPGPSTVQRQGQFGVRPTNTRDRSSRSLDYQGQQNGRKDFGIRDPRPKPFVPAIPERFRRPGMTQQQPRSNPVRKPSLRSFTQRPKPEERPTAHQADAFETSGRVAAWIKAHPSPIKPKDLDSLLDMIMDAPKAKVNAVVWNQVLGLLGREHKMERMWKAFNDMKKRGIEPTSRTYTTLINAYSGVAHLRESTTFVPMSPPNGKSMQRIIGIYNQSQQHISDCIRRITAARAELKEGQGAEDGLTIKKAAPISEDHPLMVQIRQDEEEIILAPTNAYLKYLGRYGLWSEIDKIHIAMDKEGPLSPNNITYSILFSCLLNRMAQQNAKKFEAARNELPSILTKNEFGDRIRSLWDELAKSFYPPRASTTPDYGTKISPRERRIDEELACLALSALLRARPSEERLAISLIPFLWNLPEHHAAVPAVAVPASTKLKPLVDPENHPRPERDIPPLMRNIPQLPLTVRGAGAITTMLNRADKTDVAAHYARHFVDDRNLRYSLDFSFYRSAIHALSSVGDAKTITKILDMYQPTTGKEGWPISVWDDALTATRWSADFPTALIFFRRMTHIPHGIEDGLPSDKRTAYVWTAPHGKQSDITGRRFTEPNPQHPTAKTISLLFKTALGMGSRAHLDVRRAFNIYSIFSSTQFFTIYPSAARIEKPIDLLNDRVADFQGQINPQLLREAEWKLVLAKDLRAACEIMLEDRKPEEKEYLEQTREKMRMIGHTWGPLLDAKRRISVRPPTAKPEVGTAVAPASMEAQEEEDDEWQTV